MCIVSANSNAISYNHNYTVLLLTNSFIFIFNAISYNHIVSANSHVSVIITMFQQIQMLSLYQLQSHCFSKFKSHQYQALQSHCFGKFKCNGVEWSKDRTQAAESIKWRPQQAYGSNQVLLSQPQTIFSTPKILTLTHR